VLTLTFLPALYALAIRVAVPECREGPIADKPDTTPIVEAAEAVVL